MMRIVADENIPYVEEAFGPLGETMVVPSSRIDAAAVKHADILLVRSVTQVNHELLDDSTVNFVGTATIGADHIDIDYLRSRNIHFASAPGSNATSVAEYVMAALLVLAGRTGCSLEGLTLGVVGVGNVGSLVVRMAQGLRMRVLQNDPPLERQTRESRFLPIEALMESDILTLHVPLTLGGRDATFHLVDAGRISRMKSGSMLINTSRGPVVSDDALKAALKSGHLAGAVLDVWEHEPDIDVSLLQEVDLGTPHIAGYSLDGKVNGTSMIYRAVCDFLGVEATWNPSRAMPEPARPHIELPAAVGSDEERLQGIIRQLYDIERDDAALRTLGGIPASQRGALFHRLRKTYPIRREFHNTVLHVADSRDGIQDKFAALGFRIEN